MHSSKSALFAGMVILFAYSIAYGCECVTLNSDESFKKADSIFIGRAVRIEPAGPNRKVTFEVTRSLKGNPTDYISLHQGASDCDFQFVPGWSYMVYASSADRRLFASTCSGTKVFNSRRCGQRFNYVAALRPKRFTYGEIALITAVCVSLSMSVGFFVTRVWRRKRS